MVEDLELSVLFRGFSVLQLSEIEPFCTLLVLEDGELLIQESDLDDRDLYLLCRGGVEIVSNDSQSTSSEVVISKADNELYGEMAWLSGKKRTASVRCHGGVEAIRIDGDALLEYFRRYPDLGFLFMHRLAVLLSQRLSDASSLLKQVLWNSTL